MLGTRVSCEDRTRTVAAPHFPRRTTTRHTAHSTRGPWETVTPLASRTTDAATDERARVVRAPLLRRDHRREILEIPDIAGQTMQADDRQAGLLAHGRIVSPVNARTIRSLEEMIGEVVDIMSNSIKEVQSAL